MPPTKNVWLIGAIFFSMAQHILILYTPLLAVSVLSSLRLRTTPTFYVVCVF